MILLVHNICQTRFTRYWKFFKENKLHSGWVVSMFVLLNLICIQRYRLVTLCDFRSLPWPAVCCDRVCQECSQHGRCQLHGTRLSHQTPSGNDTLNISVILQFYYYQGILASTIWVNDIQFLLTERPFILVTILVYLTCISFGFRLC